MTPRQVKDLIDTIGICLLCFAMFVALPYWPVPANLLFGWHGPHASGWLIWWTSISGGLELGIASVFGYDELQRLARGNNEWPWKGLGKKVSKAINS